MMGKDAEAAKAYNRGDGSYLGPSQIIATPVFSKDRIYVAIGQDPAHGRGRGLLHCIDATGRGDITRSGCLWTYDKINRTMCTVAVADDLVYAADLDGRLHCLDARTGAPQWRHETGHETWAGPLVGDGKIYLATRKSFSILQAGRTKKVLHTSPGGSECAPVAANGTVLAVIGPRLWALAESKEETR